MSMSRIRLLGVCAVVTGVLAAAVPTAAFAVPVITMSGSTSVAPLANLLARGYLKQYPHRAKFKIAQGGSDVGVGDVANGRVTIGDSSRDPKPSDPSGLVFNKIARDAICIITNPKNPVSNLSQDQVKALFSGQAANWSDIPGAGVSGPVDVVARTPASGTQDAFQKIIMGSTQVTGADALKASNGLFQQAVQTDPNAVGYVSLDFVTGTNAAAYEGVACNLRNAKSGQYGAVRNFWMVTRGPATGASRRFIYWIQTSAKAQAIVGKHWVPLK
jgi:phosphate transport system substrate-binding protein